MENKVGIQLKSQSFVIVENTRIKTAQSKSLKRSVLLHIKRVAVNMYFFLYEQRKKNSGKQLIRTVGSLDCSLTCEFRRSKKLKQKISNFPLSSLVLNCEGYRYRERRTWDRFQFDTAIQTIKNGLRLLSDFACLSADVVLLTTTIWHRPCIDLKNYTTTILRMKGE